jgi:hypothetical protein
MATRFATESGSGATGKEAVVEAFDSIAETIPENEVDFVAAFVSPAYEYQAVVETIESVSDGATLIGSSSAGEFTDRGSVSKTVTIAAIESDTMGFSVGLGTGLGEDTQAGLAEAAEALDPLEDDYPHVAGINVHDGLLGKGDEIVLSAYHQHPATFCGGSAGDDRQLEETVVFTNNGIESDAAALALIGSEKPFGQAVAHGHTPISEGFRVTEADGSVVHQLDGKAALEVWREAVSEAVAADHGFDVESVGPSEDRWVELLTQYEFGIQTGADEYKIRWPGLTPDDDGALHFATKIPEGTELYVMDADADDESAAHVRVGEQLTEDGDGFAGALVFSCICQANILGSEFGDSIGTIAEQIDGDIAGMEVYGEVAMQDGDMRGYHNATTSALAFPK